MDMAFDVAADAYGRFMGRYSEPLGTVFADWAGVGSGASALDVGCGPGALTRVLIDRLGLDTRLEIDGGISADTIEQAAEAGVDCFVAGSAVYGADDPARAVEALRTSAARAGGHGVPAGGHG